MIDRICPEQTRAYRSLEPLVTQEYTEVRVLNDIRIRPQTEAAVFSMIDHQRLLAYCR